MENFDRKKHWENIYATKELESCSWFQPNPHTSLELIDSVNLSNSAKIIDIGGGDSSLADFLLQRGYSDVTVMDISAAALERAKLKLGERAMKVKWMEGDASDFYPNEKYDLWHDRAAFHFLTEPSEIANYVRTAKNSLVDGGILIVGTFSENGPKKCSGIEIKQYSQEDLSNIFRDGFTRIKCINTDHPTPFGTVQNFTFCVFRKNALA